MVKPRYFFILFWSPLTPQPPSCCVLAQSIPDSGLASMSTATADLLEILETPSPIARVDHATANSFINNVQKTDDEESLTQPRSV
jgi:hypothetical protein